MSSTFKPKENLVGKIKGKEETAACVSVALLYFLCIRENPDCPKDSSAGWAGRPVLLAVSPWRVIREG